MTEGMCLALQAPQLEQVEAAAGSCFPVFILAVRSPRHVPVTGPAFAAAYLTDIIRLYYRVDAQYQNQWYIHTQTQVLGKKFITAYRTFIRRPSQRSPYSFEFKYHRSRLRDQRLSP